MSAPGRGRHRLFATLCVTCGLFTLALVITDAHLTSRLAAALAALVAGLRAHHHAHPGSTP